MREEGMETYQSLTLEELTDRLSLQEETLLLMHVSPDADTLGSSLALCALLRAAGSPTYCVCADPIPEHLAFLAEGRECLNPPEEFQPRRIVSVDVASPAQLGSLWEQYGDHISLMIDHHESGTVFADHCIVPYAAATGEMIFDLGKRFLQEGILFRIPDEFWADCYAAISSDTGGFRYSNTTSGTMRRGAELLEHDIDAAYINHMLFSQKSYSQLQAESLAFSRVHLYENGKIGIAALPYDLLRQNGLGDGDLGSVVDVIRSIRGVEIAVFVKQKTEGGDFRVSMRSSVDFNVANVCAAFGGGGHERAAGCAVHTDSAEQAEQLVVDTLRRKLAETFDSFS